VALRPSDGNAVKPTVNSGSRLATEARSGRHVDGLTRSIVRRRSETCGTVVCDTTHIQRVSASETDASQLKRYSTETSAAKRECGASDREQRETRDSSRSESQARAQALAPAWERRPQE